MKIRARSRVGLLVWGWSLAACGSGGSAEPETAGEVAAPPAMPSQVNTQQGAVLPPPSAAPEARPVWDDPSFELRSNLQPSYSPGQASSFEVVLTARGNYHVNVEYPMRITLHGPAEVSFPDPEMTADQAAEMAEPRARFVVPFTAQAAGAFTVTADVAFAVCTPDSCMPDNRTLSVSLVAGQPATGIVAPAAAAPSVAPSPAAAP